MKNKPLENNIVNIVGTIYEEPTFSHESYGESFYDFKIKTKRFSETYDVIPVTISNRLIKIEELKVGKNLSLTGELRSYNSYNVKQNKLKLVVFVKDCIILDKEDVYKDIDRVFLNGYICKQPVHRTTPLGREICDIILAVNRNHNKSNYLPIIVWGRNARYAKDLQIGQNIELEGRIQSREYEKKTPEGEILKKTAYEVSVFKIKEINEKEDK